MDNFEVLSPTEVEVLVGKLARLSRLVGTASWHAQALLTNPASQSELRSLAQDLVTLPLIMEDLRHIQRLAVAISPNRQLTVE